MINSLLLRFDILSYSRAIDFLWVGALKPLKSKVSAPTVWSLMLPQWCISVHELWCGLVLPADQPKLTGNTTKCVLPFNIKNLWVRVPAVAQSVKNLTGGAQVSAEAWVRCPAWCSGLKDLALPQLWLRFHPWLQELLYAVAVATHTQSLWTESLSCLLFTSQLPQPECLKFSAHFFCGRYSPKLDFEENGSVFPQGKCPANDWMALL